MSSTPRPGPRTLTRRTLLVASAAGVAAVATGCTSSPAVEERDTVTSAQADELAAQVGVQETLVRAYELAFAADPALAAAVGVLADQAAEQLDRLRAAAPGSSPSAAPPADAPPPGEGQAWLRAQVAVAATSHAAAALGQAGARAALMGSIAAGLRGHEARLA
ncbi:twin-arginine translocation signal domain-containing protein [Blastococcus sp. SYSU DS0510]